DEASRYELNKFPNIVFAGARTLAQLPAYVQYFDCCIIPYKVNTLTNSIYPLKINEYLAAGKPVISTNFSEDIRSFREVAFIADSHDAFTEAIQTAIDGDDDGKKRLRAQMAARNSWSDRVRQFWRIVDEHSGNKNETAGTI